MRNNALAVLLTLSAVAAAGFAGQTTAPAPGTRAADTPVPGATPAATPTPATAVKWPIAFGETAAPATHVDAQNQLTLVPLVTNATAESQTVIVMVTLRSAAGALAKTSLDCPTPVAGVSAPTGACAVAIPANQAVLPLPLTIRVHDATRDAYPLNGVVALWPAAPDKKWAEGQPRATLPLSNIELESPPTVDWAIIAGSAYWALGPILIGMVVCFALWRTLLQRMGDASFSFTESWSGALMIGSPLLTAFFTTFTSFPSHARTMSKASYLLISVLLSAIIALAPALFNLCKLPTPVTNADGTVGTQNQGVALLFFLAAFVALTGGLGQLTLLRYVIGDLANAAFLSPALSNSLVWSVGVLFWLVLVASVVSMVATVASAAQKPPAGQQAPRAENAAAPGPATRLPTWSLP